MNRGQANACPGSGSTAPRNERGRIPINSVCADCGRTVYVTNKGVLRVHSRLVHRPQRRDA